MDVFSNDFLALDFVNVFLEVPQRLVSGYSRVLQLDNGPETVGRAQNNGQSQSSLWSSLLASLIQS